MSHSLATKAFNSAFKHANKICFKPFNLSKWFKLGFINMLIGGGGASGFSFNSGGGGSSTTPSGHTGKAPEAFNKISAWIKDHQSLFAASIGILVLLFIGFVLFLMWLYSIFNFIFIDNVIKNQASIREPYHKLKPKGWSYFWWAIGFSAIVLSILGITVGVPAVLLIWLKPHMAIVILGVIYCIMAFISILVISTIISILTHDFVLPVMYLENVKILAAWKKYIPTLKAHVGQTIIYLLLKIVIAIGSALVAGIVGVIMLIGCSIPLVLLAILVFFAAKALFLTWNIITITLLVITSIAVVLGIIYIFNCLMMPLEVFRRTFGLLFLGECENKWKTLPDLL